MTDDIAAALASDRTIDITTIGRATGRPRRLEIWFHNLDGRIFITGTPGRRDWYANLLANPGFTFHLKETVEADLGAMSHPVTEPEERRSVLEMLLPRLGYSDRMDQWMADAPLVEVTFPT
jgi:hypothetical protein